MPARADSFLVLCQKMHKTHRALTVTLSLTVTNCRNGLTVPLGSRVLCHKKHKTERTHELPITRSGTQNPRVRDLKSLACRFSSDRPTARKARFHEAYAAIVLASRAAGPALVPRRSDSLPTLSPDFVPQVSPGSENRHSGRPSFGSS